MIRVAAIVLLTSVLLGGTKAFPGNYARVVSGPSTGRTLPDIVGELQGLYGDCTALLEDLAGEVTLDVGAGLNVMVTELKQLRPGTRAWGLDLRAPEGATNFVTANARDLPFADETFTRLFASYTFYLWSREDHALIREALRESYRVLAPGGRLVIIGGDYVGIERLVRDENLSFDIGPRPLDVLSHMRLTKE